MKLTEYILKNEHAFWDGGRKVIYPAGSKLLVEEEVMSTGSGFEYRYYYVYSKPNVLLGYYDKEEFFEIFMTLEEARDKKIDDLI
jgi:hypothetical protein